MTLIPAPNHVQPKRIVVFDLDGTLADGSHRLHFINPPAIDFQTGAETGLKPDWDAFYEACDQDQPIWPIIVLLQFLWQMKCPIYIVSGRSAKVADKTVAWLEAHKIPYQGLFLRPDGNHKQDYALKQEWYEANKFKPEDIFLVFEDRDQCVKMWRGLGLTCLQVCDGHY